MLTFRLFDCIVCILLVATNEFQAWAAIASAIPIVSLFLFGIFKLGPTCPPEKKTTYVECLLHVFGCIVAQGSVLSTRSMSARVVMVSWWCFFLVVGNTYVGLLISSLAVPQPPAFPVRTMEDLVTSQEHRPRALQDSYVLHMLMTSHNQTFSGIADRILTEGLATQSAAETYEFLKEGDVYIGGSNNMISFNQMSFDETKECRVRNVFEEPFISGMFVSLPVTKNGQLNQRLTRCLQRIIDVGLWEKIRRLHGSLGGPCSTLTTTTTTSLPQLSLASTTVVFYLLLAGLGLALTVLGGETVFHRARRNKGGARQRGCREIVVSKKELMSILALQYSGVLESVVGDPQVRVRLRSAPKEN